MDNRGRHTSGTLAADGDRSIPEVLKDIGSSIQQIIRWEFQLAKIEVSESARQARSSAAMLASGGLLGIFALGFLLLAALFALDLVLPSWLSALILGALLLSGAALGVSGGIRRFRAVRPPRKTIQTVKEDLQWMNDRPR